MERAMIRNNSNLMYIDDEAGVVGDLKTGLKWLHGPTDLSSWREAESWIEGLNESDSSWRLPTIIELMSLFELSIPLLDATRDGSPRWWAEEKEPHQSSVWFNVAHSYELVRYWARVGEGLLTSFSFGYPFDLGYHGATNAFAVGHWKSPDVNRFSSEELVERLGFIWVIQIPEIQNVFGDGELLGGGRIVRIATEAKEAEELLLRIGDKAKPALNRASTFSDALSGYAAGAIIHDHYDCTLFRVMSRWGSEQAERHNDDRTLRYRPCLVRQGALRVLERLRQSH